MRLCENLASKEGGESGLMATFLKQCSRIWKFGTSDDFDSIKEALSIVGSDFTKMPI
jgi:hypothetical protein